MGFCILYEGATKLITNFKKKRLMNPVIVMLVADISKSIAPLASFLTWSRVDRTLDSFCMDGLKRSIGLFEGRSCQNRMLLLLIFAVAILITLSYAKSSTCNLYPFLTPGIVPGDSPKNT